MGLILALLYAGWLNVISKLPVELTYLYATNFLFWWYLVWSIILSLILMVLCLMLTVVTGFHGTNTLGGKLGGLLGAAFGGALSLFFAFIFLIRRLLYVGGAHLLNTALIFNDGIYEWQTTRLVLGGLFLLVALLTRSRSSPKNLSSQSSH